jgi:hypothetical protein
MPTNNSTNRFAWLNRLSGGRFSPSLIFLLIILAALLAFEAFNYSTTEYALADVLGNLNFAGLRWATILSLAFCGIDFAGIARLFTPEHNAKDPNEVWYLFGAWLLAATMNAMLTWWGISMALVSHPLKSTAIIDPNTLIKAVPVFVAIMVWVIRILIIGSLSLATERMLANQPRTGDYRPGTLRPATPHTVQSMQPVRNPSPAPTPVRSYQPIHRKPTQQATFSNRTGINRAEPIYTAVDADLTVNEPTGLLRQEPAYQNLAAPKEPNQTPRQF